jgi:proteasome assembly chaperone (PAC2) family protein
MAKLVAAGPPPGRTARMKPNVVEVTFGRVFNLGNYETYRIELKATVGPHATPYEVVEALDEMSVDMRKAHKDGKPFEF